MSYFGSVSSKGIGSKSRNTRKTRELNVTENSLESLAQAAFNDICTPGNPRDVTLQDVLKLYKKAF